MLYDARSAAAAGDVGGITKKIAGKGDL